MKNSILKTTLSITLTITTVTAVFIAQAQHIVDELNLTEIQIEQLQQFRENKKEARLQYKNEQKTSDKLALKAFLSPAQVEAILTKMQTPKGDRKQKGPKPNHILELATQLELNENQIIQIKEISEANKPTNPSVRHTKQQKKAKRAEVKTQIMAVLTPIQIEQFETLRKNSKKKPVQH